MDFVIKQEFCIDALMPHKITVLERSTLSGLKGKVGSEVLMSNIDEEKHEELIEIIAELIETIALMRKEEKSYILFQNAMEASDWIYFLEKHTDKEELKTLEDEIANRFFHKFDIQIKTSNLDDKRIKLMKKYLIKSNEYLK